VCGIGPGLSLAVVGLMSAIASAMSKQKLRMRKMLEVR
jgi:hypothetical protein